MGIYLGSTDLSAASFKLGSSNVSALYQGSTKMWPAGGGGGAPITTDLLYSLDARSYAGSGTTWADDSGNGWDGTLANSPTFVSDGDSSYFTFSAASSQYAYLPYSHWNGVTPNNYPFTDMGVASGGVNFTLEFVIWTNVTTDNCLTSIWGSAAQRSLISVLRVSQERYFFGTYRSGNRFTDPGVQTGTDLGTGKWLHIVHTSDKPNNNSIIYVNGSVYYAAGSNNQTGWAAFNTRNIVLLGQDGGSGVATSNFLDGRAAVVRGYDTALTATDVADQYAYYQTRYTF